MSFLSVLFEVLSDMSEYMYMSIVQFIYAVVIGVDYGGGGGGHIAERD